MTEVSVQTFLDRLADTPLAASEVRVPIGEMKAVAAVLADRGEDPLSEERFWQEAFLRVTDDECATQEHTARLASEAVTEYLHRYGEKPEPGHPLEGALEVKRELPEPQEERRGLEWVTVFQDLQIRVLEAPSSTEGDNPRWVVSEAPGRESAWLATGPESGIGHEQHYRRSFLPVSEHGNCDPKRWCEGQETKLLAEQEGPEDA